MDQAKNFKAKDFFLRAFAFVLYYFSAGFMGNLCAVLLEPLFTLAFFRFPEIKNIALYIISASVMLAAVSFFSMREGYGDTKLLKFSYWRTAFSYAMSGVIFHFTALRTMDYGQAAGYFYAPHFIPAEIHGIMANYVFLPDIPALCAAGEYIKRFLAVRQNNLLLSVFFCVIFSAGFYKTGRKKWIAEQRKKIDQTKNK